MILRTPCPRSSSPPSAGSSESRFLRRKLKPSAQNCVFFERQHGSEGSSPASPRPDDTESSESRFLRRKLKPSAQNCVFFERQHGSEGSSPASPRPGPGRELRFDDVCEGKRLQILFCGDRVLRFQHVNGIFEDFRMVVGFGRRQKWDKARIQKYSPPPPGHPCRAHGRGQG